MSAPAALNELAVAGAAVSPRHRTDTAVVTLFDAGLFRALISEIPLSVGGRTRRRGRAHKPAMREASNHPSKQGAAIARPPRASSANGSISRNVQMPTASTILRNRAA